MAVTKVVIPAAGLGSRFLPATKTVPKEMLPLIDKPTIQHIVEEGIASGIEHFVMVTSSSRRALEDYFDSLSTGPLFEKERARESLAGIEKLVHQASYTFIRQGQPRGLGHAILRAKHLIGKELFGIMLPDDILRANTPGLGQLIKIALQEKASVIAVQEVPMEHVSSYGVVEIKKQITPSIFHVRDLVEKPTIEKAPSNLAIVGRYVLSSKIFTCLEETPPGAGGEIQLTDALRRLILAGEKVYAYKISGERFDTGTPLGLIKANIALALSDAAYESELHTYLRSLPDLKL